jgi:hypothetical protein
MKKMNLFYILSGTTIKHLVTKLWIVPKRAMQQEIRENGRQDFIR